MGAGTGASGEEEVFWASVDQPEGSAVPLHSFPFGTASCSLPVLAWLRNVSSRQLPWISALERDPRKSIRLAEGHTQSPQTQEIQPCTAALWEDSWQSWPCAHINNRSLYLVSPLEGSPRPDEAFLSAAFLSAFRNEDSGRRRKERQRRREADMESAKQDC